jgi:outer membrane biosynthesis protein TonB
MNRKRPTTLEPISAAVIVIVAMHLGVVFGIWWWWQNTGGNQRHSKSLQLAWMNPGDFQSHVPLSSVPRAKLVAAAPKTEKKPPAAPPTPSTEPSVQKATLIAAPPQQHLMEPVPNTTGTPLFAATSASPPKQTSANRSITLRRAPEKRADSNLFGAPVPPMTSPTLMDIARLNSLRPSAIPPTSISGAAAEEVVDLDAVDEAVITAFLAGWTAPPIESVPDGQREGRLNISIGKDGTVLKVQMSKFSGSHVLDQSILEASAKVKKISTTLPSNFSKDSYDLEMNFLLLP